MQRNTRNMQQIERMYSGATTADNIKLADEKYERVIQKPLDGMFERLKDKLNTLPTRAQRAEAAARERESKRTKRAAPKAKTPQ